MKFYKMLLLFVALLLGLTGCQEKDLSETAALAKEYLEQQGYKVISYEQHQESYKIIESKIETMPYSFYWKMPGNDAKLYVGKMVDVEKFIVKNHPLDNWECCDGVKSKGKVYVYVYVVEDKVVGGTSFPYGVDDAGLVGGYWSLDGRTEE
ncbi:hypothetical protein GMD78_05340 [Ornithinibacillus sp. L9]|uniref:Lipoprotein n=1 Tax=Ornithinibacillus caprae TaxID=2678566 RepID=A0A6N8FHU6_9BACI|nr:hypothetical protein [Ornithinibacillus caprae]MUK87824.1 hypothetical protein [Ornithinibacillus caprae]